ncbi:MAG: hypothetical protein AB8G17_17735 [Gammaproteobacteria bacterium]
MIRLFLTVVALSSVSAYGQAVGTCTEGDEALASRSDILFCEPFNSPTWYDDHGYVDGQSINPSPVNVANQLNRVRITSSAECLSGSCLEGDWDVGVERTLAIVWPIKEANAADSSFAAEPEEMYMRYYLKFSNSWNAEQISGNEGNGKLFGFADGRENGDPGDQCGNGGATPDGTDCWTARGLFWVCEDKASDWAPGATCNDIAGGKARLGSYIYATGNGGETTGANGQWDGYGENQTRGGNGQSETVCRRSGPPGTAEHVAACYGSPEDNFYSGLGAGDNVVIGDEWYAIETFVKMNTPGVANGVLRGWVNDKLVYEKTDMMWRLPGHDNLHVRTVWLDLYKGGISGNTVAAKSWVDQMVVARERIGAIGGTVRPNPPADFTAQP